MPDKKIEIQSRIDKHIIENVRLVRKEVRKHIITAITAGFGFLIAFEIILISLLRSRPP